MAAEYALERWKKCEARTVRELVEEVRERRRLELEKEREEREKERRVDAERVAREERTKFARVAAKKCALCGMPLGILQRLFGTETHSGCNIFTT